MRKPSVNESKKDREVDRPYARGGKTKMFGKGDRTRVATTDSAGPQKPGQTASESKSNPACPAGGPAVPGAKSAQDKSAQDKPYAGGFSKPAQPGRTSPC